MTDSAGASPDAAPPAQPPPGKVVRALLRAVGSTVVLVVIYYLLPLDHSARWTAVAMLVIGLAGLSALVTFQVRSIIASPFPGLRALEALATSVPFFLLLFASTYVVIAAVSASSFSQPMTRSNALYFTDTVFATVGFGDHRHHPGSAAGRHCPDDHRSDHHRARRQSDRRGHPRAAAASAARHRCRPTLRVARAFWQEENRP